MFSHKRYINPNFESTNSKALSGFTVLHKDIICAGHDIGTMLHAARSRFRDPMT
jgi:hypothetical protein